MSTVAPPCKERSVSPRVVEEVLPLISSALIPSKHIRLLDCIGQGESIVLFQPAAILFWVNHQSNTSFLCDNSQYKTASNGYCVAVCSKVRDGDSCYVH